MRKKLVRVIAIVIVAALILSLLMIPFAGVAFAAEKDEEVTVLFTHDLHDHILPVERTDAAGNTAASGGYARLKTAMDAVRASHETTFTLDAGDFSMGSMFQGIFASDAPELRMMGLLGIEATTFGNHEYDYGPGGLASSLDAARASGDAIPQIVQANYTTPLAGNEASEGAQALTRAMADYGVQDYIVLERNGVTLAVFGIMGKDSDTCAPTSEMALADPIETAQRVVADIQANTDADMIVCLSHSGTWEDPDQSEDELLAKAVPEIDLIISGHTHTSLDAPIRVGTTSIVSCGSYAENLGVITLESDGDSWTPVEYALHPIDDTLAEDAAANEKIETFKALVQEKCLAMYGMTFDQVLARNEILFPAEDDLYATNEEVGFGNLLADSYIYALQQLEGADYEPVALTAVPLGIVRASLPLGELTTSNAFDVLSLGTGQDGSLGYPLVEVYLTGRELSDVAEIDASVSSMMSYAKLYLSGISYTYNPNRLPLDFVTDVKLVSADGSLSYPEEDKLYRVVADMYSAQMFGSVKDLAYGFLRLTPKDANGNEITDFNTAILRDKNGNEIKAWQSLAMYLGSFEPDEDGVSLIPERYAQGEGRKILDDDSSISAMLADPGPVTILVLGVCAVILAVFIALCTLMVKRWNKRLGYGPDQPERLG